MFQFVLQSRYYWRWHAGEHLDEFPICFSLLLVDPRVAFL